jgi:hypothetical protein
MTNAFLFQFLVVLIVWVIVLMDWWGRRKDRRSGQIPH